MNNNSQFKNVFGDSKVEVKTKQILEMPNLNHLFQNCLTGNITEYGALEETISPAVLEKVNAFLGSIWN